MNILRIASPGDKLEQWVPSWDSGESSQSLSVECMTFTEGHENDWLGEVQRYLEGNPRTVIQYEGKECNMSGVPLETTACIHVFRHLTEIPRKQTNFSYFVVPSYYAREFLRRKGFRAVTMQPVTEMGDVSEKVKPSSGAALTVLLNPGTTTKRLLQTVRALCGNRLEIEWLLIDDGSKRVQSIERVLKSVTERVSRTGNWQQADVIVTDQHPAYSLNTLHLRMMTHGIPVMTTAVGDHPELVKHWHNGFLLEVRKLSDDLTYYLKRIIRERHLLNQLTVNGRSLCEKFHLERHVETDWIKLYRMVGREAHR